MSKIARVLGTCLLIGSLTTVAWAEGGETAGVGKTAPAPAPAPAPTGDLTDIPNGLAAEPEASTTTEVMNIVVTWLFESIL